MVKTVKLDAIIGAALIICCMLTESSLCFECKFATFNSLVIDADKEIFKGHNNWTVNDSAYQLLRDITNEKSTCHSLRDTKKLKAKTNGEHFDSNFYQKEVKHECIRFMMNNDDICGLCIDCIQCKNSTTLCNGICNEECKFSKNYSSSKEEMKDNNGNELNLVLTTINTIILSGCVIVKIAIYFRSHQCKSSIPKEQNEGKGNGIQTGDLTKSRETNINSEEDAKSRDINSEEDAKSRDIISEEDAKSRDINSEEDAKSRDINSEEDAAVKATSLSPNEIAKCDSDINISKAQPTSTSSQEPVSENELCTSATNVKQYIFSSSVRGSKQEESRNRVNVFEPLADSLQSITTKKFFLEHDRLFQESIVLDIWNDTEEINDFEETAQFKLLTDFDQDHAVLDLALSDLKLPDPDIFESEETSLKGHSRITNNFNIYQVSLSSGYPFNSHSSQSHSRKSSGEIGSFFENDFIQDLENDYIENINDTNIELAESMYKVELDGNTDVPTDNELIFDFEKEMTNSFDEKSKPKSEVNEKALDKTVPDEKESSELNCDIESLLDSTDDIDEIFQENGCLKIKQENGSCCRSSCTDSDGNSNANSTVLSTINDTVSLDLDMHDTDVQTPITYSFENVHHEVRDFDSSKSVRQLIQVGVTLPRKTRNIHYEKCKKKDLKKNKRKTLKEGNELQPNNRQNGEKVLFNVQGRPCNEMQSYLESASTDCAHANKGCDNRPDNGICFGTEMLSLNGNTIVFTSSCKGKSNEFDIVKASCKMKRYSLYSSSDFGNFFSKNRRDERKDGNLDKTVTIIGVNVDSGFSSGSIKYDYSSQTKTQDFLENSPTKLLHDCLKADVMLQKMSRRFFQNLKIFKNMIEDEEERRTVKQISREFHFSIQSVGTFFPGLNSYFDRLNNGPPPTTREQMQYEWLRLSSFHNYTGHGNALALARNGFYHDHSDGPNSTRCFLCEAQYSEWEMLDDIPEQHKRLSPNCPFHGNHEDESLNVSITYGEVNDQPTRSSAPSSTGGSIVLSTVSSSSSTAAVTEVARSLQGTSISQARVGNIGGESISQQPTEDLESDRSMLALTQPRAIRALGRTGHSYASIMAPTRNNVASGARSNAGVDPGPDVTRGTSSQIPGIRPSSILGGPVGAGAFAGPQTGVSRAKENLQQSNVPTPAVEAAPGAKQPNPAPGGGGRTDPNITVVVDNPKHPDYLNVDRRVNSYQGWPEYLDQTPRQMAEAGFFFVGVADFTRCFCCGGGLRNWEPGDDPVLEHTRWFPRCEYINKLKGERYVAAVQRRHEEHMAEQQRQQNELAQRRDQNRNQPDPMTITAAITLQDMGYSAERTREAVIAVRQQTGQSNPSTEQVLTWILDNEEGESGNRLTSELGVRPQPSVASSIANTTGGTSTPSSSNNTGTIAPTTIVGTSIPSSIISTPTTVVGTSIPSIQNAAANTPTTILDNSIPSSIYVTGFSVPSSVEVSTSIIGTQNVNVVSTSQVSAGTTTSTVSSTSTAATPRVQLSPSASASTEENLSATSSASGSSSGSNDAKRASSEKQQSGVSGDSDESKQASKDASSSESSNKSSKKKNGKKKAKNKPRSETAGATGGDIDAKSLKAENEKLKEMQTCKICMERAVNTTLLPCGHLVCCETCAGRLQRCPICRKKIKGTVKTFMS